MAKVPTMAKVIPRSYEMAKDFIHFILKVFFRDFWNDEHAIQGFGACLGLDGSTFGLPRNLLGF